MSPTTIAGQLAAYLIHKEPQLGPHLALELIYTALDRLQTDNPQDQAAAQEAKEIAAVLGHELYRRSQPAGDRLARAEETYELASLLDGYRRSTTSQ